MAALTRRIHFAVDRTLAPSSASQRQLADLGVGNTALQPRGVDLQAFHPVHRSAELRRRIAPDGRLLVGYVGRLAPDPLLRTRMGLAARRSVRDRSWGAVDRALVEHYRDVIAGVTTPDLLAG